MCRGQEWGALLARRVQATVNGLRKRDQVVVNEELTGAVDKDGFTHRRPIRDAGKGGWVDGGIHDRLCLAVQVAEPMAEQGLNGFWQTLVYVAGE